MNLKKFLLVSLLAWQTMAFAQGTFTFSPEHPQPGDKITVTYKAFTNVPVTAVAKQLTEDSRPIETAFPLTRAAGQYSGTITADTAANFVYFEFTAGGTLDGNAGKGFWILLYNGDQVRKGAYANLAYFYEWFGYEAGVERNTVKAAENLDKEFALYPSSRKDDMLINYLRFKSNSAEGDATALYRQEIDQFLSRGLKEEEDYEFLAKLYAFAKLPEESKEIKQQIKLKFPGGKWVGGEAITKFRAEKDTDQKEHLLREIITNTSQKPNWKQYQQSIPGLWEHLAGAYAKEKNWTAFKKTVENLDKTNVDRLASFYNNTAWAMQQDSSNLPYAEEISRFATEQAKKNWTKAIADKKPEKEVKGAAGTYAMYADTYAMVMYRLGSYKKGLPFAKASALTVSEGKNIEFNNTYALLAERALPTAQIKLQLEKFVKDGKSTSEIKDMLKEVYRKEKKSLSGFDQYITALEEESRLKMLAELKKSMQNEPAPGFSLLNLDGSNVNLPELKGKVVVIDFWSTWCGPCISSFPAMQKAVDQYKNDANVKFVFINSWENEGDVKKNVSEFIRSKKYTFDVLFDSNNKVIEAFKVDGIPTKFVLDKSGNIRFKSVGFNGGVDQMVQELTAMIDLASRQ